MTGILDVFDRNVCQYIFERLRPEHVANFRLVSRRCNIVAFEFARKNLYYVIRNTHKCDEFQRIPQGITKLHYDSPVSQSIFTYSGKITHVQLGWKFEEIPSPTVLPPSMEHLTILGNVGVCTADELKLLKRLKSVEFCSVAGLRRGSMDDCAIAEWEFRLFKVPLYDQYPALTKLCFGYLFNRPVDNLPPTLLHLQLGFGFNLPVDHLPCGLQRLYLGPSFNRPVDHLPPGLKRLKFEDSRSHKRNHGCYFTSVFNQRIDHLPPFLTHLKLSDLFDQPVPALPKSITHLVFGAWFNQPVDALPSSLRWLSFGDRFNQPLNVLPAGTLCVKTDIGYQGNWRELPASVKWLVHDPHYCDACVGVHYLPRLRKQLPCICGTKFGLEEVDDYCPCLPIPPEADE